MRHCTTRSLVDMDTFKKWTGGYENVGETHQVRRRDRAMRRSGANARAGAGGRTDGRKRGFVRFSDNTHWK
jgi:hypothetical protein